LNTVSKSKLDPIRIALIFGPTAVGKTDLLLELFHGNIEIINADSMQVYRGMDIGTAKPDVSTRGALVHHLIDVRNPDEQFNAGEFVKAADDLVRRIDERGSRAVLAGGTPFYFRNFLYGLPETPAGDPAVRARVSRHIDAIGTEAAHQTLRSLDPESADRISVRDRYRIERALEVIQITGRRFSEFSVPCSFRDDYEFLLIGLDRPRKELYERIDARVCEMFRAGLVQEVAALMDAGYGEDDPGMQGIGYREFSDMARNGCDTLVDVRLAIARNSRRYAKRQLTFFKRFPEVRWFHPGQIAEIRKSLRDFYGGAVT
jgi:tRNA dimethylallyltransferase